MSACPCMCFRGLLLKAFAQMSPFQLSIPPFLQLNHSLLSVSACSRLFSLLEDMVSYSLFPVLLRTPPPCPSNHSHCLSGSHGPPTKAVGGGQWNNSWHPYGLHFADRYAVTVLLCVSMCVSRRKRTEREGREDKGICRERDGAAK